MLSPQVSFNHSGPANTSLLNTGMIPSDKLFAQLSESIRNNQWIWFTSQSVRPSVTQLASFRIPANQVIQLKASAHLSEFEVATKAIKSGNASALVVSNTMTQTQQQYLEDLSNTYQCKIFFVKPNKRCYH
ncbi:hypothetical protein [Vibrio salinus]|uniref:hypothetical protein n=1 Tax=Vibrio salinus TaxID=2899784 RepID=UPI001E5F04D7|nr:hypothetical protein [Vibrio salinus]MCE0492675.1 hypothetical protein [Vibrio salinus]